MKFFYLLFIAIMLLIIIPLITEDKIKLNMDYNINCPINKVYTNFYNIYTFSKWEKLTCNQPIIKYIYKDKNSNKSYIKWILKNNKQYGTIMITDYHINDYIKYIMKYNNLDKEDILYLYFKEIDSNNTNIKIRYLSHKINFLNKYFIYFTKPENKIIKTIENILSRSI